MDSDLEWHAARAALEWQIEAGADEAILDASLDRYQLAATAAPAPSGPPSKDVNAAIPPRPAVPDPGDQLAAAVAEARQMAGSVDDLPRLSAAIAAYAHCDLKQGARNTVFSDGDPAARVMIIGEAPGREEDIRGKPFVGRAGQLLDRMLAAIGLDRTSTEKDKAVYITNVLPWRPPGNRTPDAGEIAMLLPFLERHVELAAPDLVVLMGNTPCQAILGRAGITRIRGNWTEALSRPVLPMFHPAYLLRQPLAKRDAWADLLSLRARLNETG